MALGGAVFLLVLYTAHAYECDQTATVCETKLVISNFVTMLHQTHRAVYPSEGKLYKYDVTNTSSATPIPESEVIVGDGYESQRLVVVANMSMPGPDIIVYEGQRLIVHVENRLHSEAVTIHWHGLPQEGSVYMDGVAFVTQCPINPESTFTYDFMARPKGTYWYHSHIGSQRAKGLLGALIIRERQNNPLEEHIIQVQGWNHDYDADLGFQYMNYGLFKDRAKQSPSQSLDGSFFSLFDVQSGLINGKGRYKSPVTNQYNSAPIEVYNVTQGRQYRFRVIGVGSLYPFRMSVDNHMLTIIASDGFDVKPMVVESFVINPGERFDFILNATENVANYWIRGQTLEINKETVAWAVLRYDGAPMEDPTSTKIQCTQSNKCNVLNCPYTYYPEDEHIICHQFDALKSLPDNDPAPQFVNGQSKEYMYNFGFPGTTWTPSTINGKRFVFPPVSAVSQPDQITTSCDNAGCNEEVLCSCTHTVALDHDDTIQMVFSNLGVGRGWAHPIHLHGHSFYVLKMGYATYNETTGKFISQTDDILCTRNPNITQDKSFCNDPTWANSSWHGDNIPGLELNNPPRKDTIIVPSGGYVVIRIKANNPGLWIMHCHIELHSSDGMVMLFNESYPNLPLKPKGFPTCNNFPPNRMQIGPTSQPFTDRDQQPQSTQKNFADHVETIELRTFWIVMFVLLGVC
ncbi:hypothetical protein FSP39_012062 [Pinctada imbricata]|uniref:Uncharacterized protein n=1 Tax=Pinctada imbricata TaxID=66713 RepID=A0AA89C1H9_PINIB|nr:hypothetical protein FSP39_012062 [Pinctada imbricata]